MAEFLAAGAGLVSDLKQTIQTTKLRMVSAGARVHVLTGGCYLMRRNGRSN
jgi:hypothetical protein